MLGACPFLSGRCARTHSTIATARMTVPARRRKIRARSKSRKPIDRNVGYRYGGISSMKGVRPLLRIVDFNMRAVMQRAPETDHVQPEHRGSLTAQKRAEQLPLGNEGRDDERVHRQPRRARHERRDENRRDAVALVLDGARRHDRGHGAGIGRQQRDKRLSLQARTSTWCDPRSAPREPGSRSPRGCR